MVNIAIMVIGFCMEFVRLASVVSATEQHVILYFLHDILDNLNYINIFSVV